MNEGENAPRLCSTDISTGESGNLTPDLNLGTYKNQLFLPKKEKTLIKLANLFAQLNNSSMPPVLMEDQQQGKITRAVLWRETWPGNLVGGAPILFVQRWLNQCGLQRQSGPGPNSTRALQGGQERAWGQKRQRSSMQRQVDPEEPSLDGLFAGRASA